MMSPMSLKRTSRYPDYPLAPAGVGMISAVGLPFRAAEIVSETLIGSALARIMQRTLERTLLWPPPWRGQEWPRSSSADSPNETAVERLAYAAVCVA